MKKQKNRKMKEQILLFYRQGEMIEIKLERIILIPVICFDGFVVYQ